MKLQLDPKTAREAIAFVTGIVSHRTTMPILSHLRITANGETQFTCTDLDVTLTARLPVEGALDTSVSAKSLLAAVKGAKERTEIDTDDKGRCLLTVDGFTSTLPTLSAEEFPVTLRVPDDAKRIVFSAPEFVRALSQVQAAQSTDQSRYVLNGVCLKMNRELKQMRLVATDGRRLHVAAVEADTDYTKPSADVVKKAKAKLAKVTAALPGIQAKFPPVPKQYGTGTEPSPQVQGAKRAITEAQYLVDELETGPRILLTSETVRQMLRLPSRKAGEIVIESWTSGESNYTRTTAGAFTIVAKQITGNYPNWRQVVPSEFKEEFVVEAEQLAAALKHADSVTKDNCLSVKLTLSKHTLNVRGYSADKGEAKSDIAINYKGKEFAIAFNPGYLLDVCAAFKKQPLTVKLVDELSPGYFVQDNTFAVVMPMRLS